MGIQSLVDIFFSLLGPWQFMGIVFSYLPRALLRLIHEGHVQPYSISRIRNAWFKSFWSVAGANIREGNGPRLTALLEGRISGAEIRETASVLPAGGVILDIGPASGFWVDLYAEFTTLKGHDRLDKTCSLKVYGIEPNTEVHPELLMRIHKAGLDDVYEVVPAGIQSISSFEVNGINGRITKIEKGSVDCIVSFLCLCSIPDPEKNIAELYQYLKKGGRWYLFEHVKAQHNLFIRSYQAFVNIFWPRVLNGCELCRDTEASLRRAGPWEAIDLAQRPEEPWHQVLPHILGTLTK